MEPPPTEARHPHSSYLDRLSALDIVRVMNAADRGVAEAVGKEAVAIAHAIDLIAQRIESGGRLLYVGAGSSGRLGVVDAAECPPTFGVAPDLVRGIIAGGADALTRAIEGAEDSAEAGARDLERARVGARDVVVGIAASGRTPYVLGAIAFAKAQEAATISVSAVPHAPLAQAVDIAISVDTGPEILAGSTRLKAGTAAKLVLNMLSTGAMVRLGRTYGNRMVDLVATNTKLRARARAMVADVVACSADEAEAALNVSDQSVKLAIVVAKLGLAPAEARSLLARHHGRLRDVLEAQAPTTGSTPAESLVLGVDGGASKTTAWLAPASAGAAPVGRASTGPGNPRSVGFAVAEANLDRAIELAHADAGVPRRRVAAAALSIAGAGRAEERGALAAWAERAGVAGRVVVTDDAESVLAAGAPEGWGIALISGTGTMALGRNAAGDVERAGGWGYLLGDEGSGYDIALAGLRAAVRAADGRGPMTSLVPAFLEHFRVASPAELVGQVYRAEMTRDRLAALASIVFAEAPSDWAASGIIDVASADLVRLVTTIATRLALVPGSFPLALAGSVLLHQPAFQELLINNLKAWGMPPRVVRLVPEPAEGAVVLARRTLASPDISVPAAGH
jgi:N-acetylmuramic acid 6-phosphate etherase